MENSKSPDLGSIPSGSAIIKSNQMFDKKKFAIEKLIALGKFYWLPQVNKEYSKIPKEAAAEFNLLKKAAELLRFWSFGTGDFDVITSIDQTEKIIAKLEQRGILKKIHHEQEQE